MRISNDENIQEERIMSLWDSLKKFAQPYGDEEFDDYEEEEGLDTYEEEVEEERPARRRGSFFNFNTTEETDYKPTPAATATTTSTHNIKFQPNNRKRPSLRKHDCPQHHPWPCADSAKGDPELLLPRRLSM